MPTKTDAHKIIGQAIYSAMDAAEEGILRFPELETAEPQGGDYDSAASAVGRPLTGTEQRHFRAAYREALVLLDAVDSEAIERLRVAAAQAGDDEQVRLCVAALGGDWRAWGQCATAMDEGLQEDDDRSPWTWKATWSAALAADTEEE